MKNVVVLDKKALLEIANGEKKIDGRTNNTGRPINKNKSICTVQIAVTTKKNSIMLMI